MSHAERQHSICSASAADRWLNCPGSVGLALTLPEPPTSPQAAEGTKAHELAERILKHWLESSYNVEDKFLSDLINEGVDQEMLSHVMTYVNACNSAAICFSGTPAIRIEHRLAFDERMEMFGTADFIVTGLMDGIPTGMIVDLKYGKGKKVKTEENPQLAFYAVALKLNSKKALKRVIVQIVQPRMDYEPVAVEFSEDDLNRWREKLTLGAEQALWMASKHKEPKYTQGSWCWFCPAKSICPEVQRKVDEQVLSMFDDVPPAL